MKKVQLLKYLHTFYQRAEGKVRMDNLIKNCDICDGLNLSRETESAPGYGNVMSSIMFIGQSLCTKCMLTQIPFTRGSGDLLDEIFLSIGKHKYDYFITNVVHCHPPKNRPSTKTEIQNCRKFLEMEIRLIRPKTIVCLGKDAATAIFPGARPPEQLKFETVLLYGLTIEVVWIYHPAYFVHRHDVKGKAQYKKNLRRILTDDKYYHTR